MKRFQVALVITTLVFSPIICRAEITVSLTKGFVKKVKDKATISTAFRVNEHHDHPNPVGEGSKDGDIHIAGRDSIVRLPIVAEIINGRKENDTLSFLLQRSLDEEVSVIGAWRFWFEHPGSIDQIQTAEMPPRPDGTNPDHVFELHPIVQFGSFDCRDSFAPIKDGSKEFTGYPADVAFPSYEKKAVIISRTSTGIMITSKKADYNYVNFEMRLAGKPKDVGDGYIVLAKVYAAGADDEAEPVVDGSRRMIFVKGTAPADAVKDLKKGAKLHVLGIPRVNLNQVLAIANGLEGNDTYSAGWSKTDECSPENPCLPWEMIIVAILK
jgi:hypothetical protein